MIKKNKHKDKKNKDSDINIEVDAEKVQQAQQADEAKQEAKSEIEMLQEQYNALDEKFKRLSADYANYQKRVPRQIEESVAYKVESFIKSLLPGIDSFDYALAHSTGSSAESMKEGLELVYINLLEILKKQGLEQIDAGGCEFDPNCHQAVMQKAQDDVADGVVLEQYQKGYKLNGRLIRPAMVVVNKLSMKAEEPEDLQQKQSQQPSEQAEQNSDFKQQDTE